MMKKLILVVLAVFLMCGIASAATTLEMSGYMRIHPETNNFSRTGASGVFTPIADAGTLAFTDQRTRWYFNVKSNENLGATVAIEISNKWGQSAGIDGRASGGGFMSDTNSMYIKNANMWFKQGGLKVTAGSMSFLDGMSGIVFGGADMSGFLTDYTFSKSTAMQLGAFTFWDRDLRNTDAVMFYPLTVTQQLGGGKAQAFLYMINDNSNYIPLTAGAGYGFRPITTANTALPQQISTNAGAAAAYENAKIYYAGLNYAGKAGPVGYSLFGVYNFGTFKNFDNSSYATAGGGTAQRGDATISAYAANVKADMAFGASKLRFSGLYVSGTETDYSKEVDKFRGFVTGGQYGGGADQPLLQNDLHILTNNTDCIGYAQFLMYDVNNNGDGVMLASLAFDQPVAPKLTAKAVAGYAAANKQNNAARNGKGMGTELNAQLKYDFDSNLNIKLVYAYAMLGDYFKTATVDPDNVWRAQIKFTYSF
jgi:hypothetical protein